MGNIYICFYTLEEKNDFLIRLLDLQNILSGKDGTKRSKKEKESIFQFLLHVELKKKDNSYYKLHREFYSGHIPDDVDKSCPWSQAGLFARGIRSLYMQRSYMNRPGYWICIDLRDTRQGGEKYRWIMANVPSEQIGTNVPLPGNVLLKQKA